MLLKLIFNIFVVYAIWQLIKMMTSVNKTQERFHKKMNEMNREMDNYQAKVKKKKDNNEGEYIDYEELK